MKLDMFNLREFIRINKLVPVTSPIGLTPTKMPNPNGIYSYEIFGYTTEDRRNTFSYINLNGYFFHPQCYKTLARMGSLGKILTGEKYAVIADGKVHVADPNEFPDAETGIDFYYNNWEKINWKTTSVLTHMKEVNDDEISIDKGNKFKFFDLLKKEEVFIDCWLVLPPYYRDINTEDSSMGDDINKLYNELISRANSMKSGFGFSSFGDVTKNRIQQILNMLYDMTMGPVSGKSVDITDGSLKGTSKRALIRKNLIGRTIDFGGYSVIVAPLTSTAETVDEFAKFGQIKLPLQTFMSMTKPFFVNYCAEFFEKFANNIKASIKTKPVKIDSSQWSVTTIDKMLSRFIKTAADKDTPVVIKYKTKENDYTVESMAYTQIVEADDEHGKNAIVRPLTYLDLYYIAAIEIAKDKYAISIRHPVTNYQNSYSSKITLNSTIKSRKKYVSIHNIDNIREFVKYDNYPCIGDIEFDGDVIYKSKYSETECDLIRATVVGNGIIKSLGADYDKIK